MSHNTPTQEHRFTGSVCALMTALLACTLPVFTFASVSLVSNVVSVSSTGDSTSYASVTTILDEVVVEDTTLVESGVLKTGTTTGTATTTVYARADSDVDELLERINFLTKLINYYVRLYTSDF